MEKMIKKKCRAAFTHLVISLFLVCTLLSLILLICYPSPYFKVMGIGKLVALVVLVDVALGPLITLIVFNPRKRFIKLELAAVVILQIAALVYGVSTLFLGRPVYVVFDENGFTLVSAYQVPQMDLEEMNLQFLPMTGPKIVGARIPTAKEERKKYIARAVEAHVDLPRMLRYHVPYEEMIDDVKQKMKSLDLLLEKQPLSKLTEVKSILNNAIISSGAQFDELAFVPMNERDTNLTVLVRRANAKIVTVLPIDPFGT